VERSDGAGEDGGRDEGTDGGGYDEAGVDGMLLAAGGAGAAGAALAGPDPSDATGVGNCTRWAKAGNEAKAHHTAARPQTILAVFTTLPFAAWRGRDEIGTAEKDAFNTQEPPRGQDRFATVRTRPPHVWRVMGVKFCPVGAFDNSPAAYCWDGKARIHPSSPVGTLERNHSRFNRPYGTEMSITFFQPGDKSPGYFQPTLRVERLAGISQ
jgi:hypothetical protein